MASEKLKGLTISVIPGTGNIGRLLVKHLSVAGLSVVLGSRSASKGKAVAAELSKFTNHPVKGLSNEEAAAAGEVIFWTPAGPLADREALLKSLAIHLEGKIIIDITNIWYNLDESKWGQTSATLLNEKALGVPARWTSTLNTVFAEILEKPNVENPFTVFVTGDDTEAVAITVALVESIPGFKALKAGPLKESRITELLNRFMFMTDVNNFEGTRYSGFRVGR